METTLQSYPVSTAEREEIKFEDQLGASIAIYHELTSFGVKTIEFYRTVKEKKKHLYVHPSFVTTII